MNNNLSQIGKQFVYRYLHTPIFDILQYQIFYHVSISLLKEEEFTSVKLAPTVPDVLC